MRMIMRIVALAVALLLISSVARAAELHALITTAMKDAIDELTPSFERDSGNTLHVGYGPSGGVARRFLGGEPADVIVVGSDSLDDLIRQGKVLSGATAIARTGIGICVKKGAPHPDVATPEALKRALLAAKTVGYTAPAGGGVTAAPILRVFERLGISEQVAAKTRLAAGGPNGRVSVLVSSGEAEIALQQVSELMTNPDVDVIGMLPGELQQITTYSGGITADAKEPGAGRALLGFLASPAATAVYKTKGLAF
jgi:molybdate transport system substrate-binding protein